MQGIRRLRVFEYMSLIPFFFCLCECKTLTWSEKCFFCYVHLLAKTGVKKSMKKVIEMIISMSIVLCFCGCGKDENGDSGTGISGEAIQDGQNTQEETAEEAPELIRIKGIYYGELSSARDKSSWSSAEGMTDCVVVFDFVNDDENRKMPETDYVNTSAIQLDINGKNTYTAFKSAVPFGKVLERYSSIKQVIGYGNVLGGADPVSMYAIFFINPNDFKTSEEIVLTIDDAEGRIGPESAKEIKYINTMIEETEGYESEKIEEFLWRCDSAYWNIVKTSKTASQNPGSDYKLVSDCMHGLFSGSYGVNLNQTRDWGGDGTLRRARALVEDLEGFNADVITEACPEIAADISTVISACGEYADAIVNPYSSVSGIGAIVDRFETSYLAIMRYFSMSKTS